MATRLGVDLGTTWTAAAIADNGRPEVLQLGTHTLAIASVVARDGEQLVVGEAAERRMATEPAAGAREMKRRLGDTTPIVVGGTPYGAEALMAQLLAFALERATAQLGSPPEELTLTHPANWGEYKLDLVREIARLAGRDDAVLVAEPVAAALQYASLGRLADGDKVAVYDFGGGTFDVAIVEVGADGAKILGTPGGLERLGGVDIDQMVMVHVDGALDGKLREVDTTQPDVRAAIAQLRASCTAAKETLSVESDAVISVALPDLRTDVRLTRSEFEAVVRERVNDTLAALDRALASAGIDAGDLAGVLLVGGSSRVPLVGEMLGAHTGRPVFVDADAKAVVALGAASGGAIESATADLAAVGAVGSEGAAGAVAGGAGTDRGSKAEKSGGRARGESGSAATRVVAGVAGAAVAAGTVAAGVYGYQRLTDDDGGATDDGATDDETMDAFDSIAGDVGGGLQGGLAGAAESLGSGGDPTDALAALSALARSGSPAGADPTFNDSVGGRVASRLFPQQSSSGESSGGGGGGSESRGAAATRDVDRSAAPGSLFSDPEIEGVRAQLRERLAAFAAPEGADPAEVAELEADLGDLLDHFNPYAGQSVDDAVASLKHQFEDRVRDFAQDQKLDALVEAEQADRDAAAALDAEVDDFRGQLRDRLENWAAPDGADAGAVDDMKADLQSMLDRYAPIPGQSAEDALADLRARFNDRVRDFAQDQKLDAVVEDLSVEDPEPGAAAPGEVPGGEWVPGVAGGWINTATGEQRDSPPDPDEVPPTPEIAPGAGTDTETGDADPAAINQTDGPTPAAMPTAASATSDAVVSDNFDALISGADPMATSEVSASLGAGAADDQRIVAPATASALIDDDALGVTAVPAAAAATSPTDPMAASTGDSTAIGDVPQVDAAIGAGIDAEIPTFDVANPDDAFATADLDAMPDDFDSTTSDNLDAMADTASLPDDMAE
jgi:actin-like ATPase involved in cell morphogenesis